MFLGVNDNVIVWVSWLRFVFDVVKIVLFGLVVIVFIEDMLIIL